MKLSRLIYIYSVHCCLPPVRICPRAAQQSRTTDTKMLQETFAQYSGVKSGVANVVVWWQWLSKGALK